LCGLAALFGGGSVQYQSPIPVRSSIGLDWFVLDLLLLAVVFIPLECLFPLRPAQKIFRAEWKKDLLYFCVNHLFFQTLMAIAMVPSQWLKGLTNGQLWVGAFAHWHPILQFLVLVFAIDFFQYWIHRAFHQWPLLWKLHRVHHSPKEMDWLAGSRLHVVDIVLTRGVLFLPLTLLGFEQTPLQLYLIFAAMQTVFIHANVRWRLSGFRWILATPVYHHWHHSSDKAALDKNFSVHLPLFDLLFGTYHYPPNKWPSSYGLYKVDQSPR
jgi:sterol desaturase/sphingolipid hydroxylase (fatty acid hydroxylase superfamily)